MTPLLALLPLIGVLAAWAGYELYERGYRRGFKDAELIWRRDR
jgi:hypothetical protein